MKPPEVNCKSNISAASLMGSGEWEVVSFSYSPLPVLESFLALESVAQKENMSRRPQTIIDRENILGQYISAETPAGAEVREYARRVPARASTQFDQAETCQAPAEKIGAEVEVDRVPLPDDQRRRPEEQAAPDVCL